MTTPTHPTRLAWGLTGSGHCLRECLDLAGSRGDVDLFLTRAAEEVLAMYGIDLEARYRDRAASAPLVGRLYQGRYAGLVIAPATSNTVAKLVAGISDTLVTNLYAQAGKCRVPCIVLPCDTAAELATEAPGGPVMVYPRPIDLENVERLRGFPLTRVVDSVDALAAALDLVPVAGPREDRR